MKCAIAVSAFSSSLVSIFSTLLVLAATRPASADAQDARLRAAEFTLVGSDGSERLTLTESRFGGAFLRIAQGGETRIGLVAANRDPESSALSLNDTAGRRRIWLALKQGTTATSTGEITGIALLDQEERIRVHMGVDGDGSPFIQFLDADGKVTWAARE